MTKFIGADENNIEREAFSLFDLYINNNVYLVYYINRQGETFNIFALKKDNNDYIDIVVHEKEIIKEAILKMIKQEQVYHIQESLVGHKIKFNIKADYIATTNNNNLNLIKIKEPVTINLQENIVQRVNEENDTLLVVNYDYYEAIKNGFTDKINLDDLDDIMDNINKKLEEDKNKELSYSYGFINYNILGLISIVAFIMSLLFLAIEVKLFK